MQNSEINAIEFCKNELQDAIFKCKSNHNMHDSYEDEYAYNYGYLLGACEDVVKRLEVLNGKTKR